MNTYVYVYMCAYVCVGMPVMFMYVCVCLWKHISARIYLCESLDAYLWCAYVCMCTCLLYMHMYKCKCVFVWTYACINERVQFVFACMCACMYINVCGCGWCLKQRTNIKTYTTTNRIVEESVVSRYGSSNTKLQAIPVGPWVHVSVN